MKATSKFALYKHKKTLFIIERKEKRQDLIINEQKSNKSNTPRNWHTKYQKSIVYSSATLFTIYKVWGEEAIESESCQKAVLWVRTHFLFYPDPTNLKRQNPD